MAPLLNKFSTSFPIMIDAISVFLFWLDFDSVDNKGFDSNGIVTILSQFLKFLDPLLILLTLLQNVLNALPVELLVCFITDFSQMNELFVTSSWISSG